MACLDLRTIFVLEAHGSPNSSRKKPVWLSQRLQSLPLAATLLQAHPEGHMPACLPQPEIFLLYMSSMHFFCIANMLKDYEIRGQDYRLKDGLTLYSSSDEKLCKNQWSGHPC